jgi:putative ABC transport system permease protein
VLVVRLALRALAWRAGVSLTVFAVALIGVLAAAIGPIYLRAVDQTVLAERLVEAPQKSRDVHVGRTTITGAPEVNWIGSIRSLAALAADSRWFDPAVHSEEAQVTLTTKVEYASQLAAIDDLCTHVHLVAGRCLNDDDMNSTVISGRTARNQHISVGDELTPTPAGGAHPLHLRVVGVVDPVAVHGGFWTPWNYFNQTPAIFDNQLPRMDSLFVSHRMMASHLDDIEQTVAADVRLRTSSVSVEDVPALKHHIEVVVGAAAASSGQAGLTATVVGSQLPDVLEGMDKEMSLARTLIILPTAQLVLLAMFILYAVVAGTTAALGPEVALAKLRGRRSRSILLQGVVQPIALIVIATPVAALLAWLVVRLVADHLLGRHVTVVFPLSAIAVIGAAAAAAVLAAIAAARRIVVSPVGALLRRGSDTSGSSLGLALADAATVTLALAGLAQLIAGGVLDSGKTSPLSALAPVLLGVAIAIVVLRLLPYAGRVAVSWTRDSRRIASFLAVRQIVRRPASARVLLPVGIALSLATFALVNWSVAGKNRSARALNQAGAATVLRVQPSEQNIDLRGAVDRADPSGNSMAAVYVQNGRSTPLLAVDTERFAGVAAWRDNYSSTPLSQVLNTLRGADTPSIALTGDRLRLTVQVIKQPVNRVDVSLDITNAQHLQSAYVVPLTGRSGSYDIDLGHSCLEPCRITGMRLEPANSQARVRQPDDLVASVSAQVRSNGSWQPVDGFDDAKRWRDDESGFVQFRSAPPALRIDVAPASIGGQWPSLISRDMPSHLPAVLASGTAELYPGPSAHDAASFGIDSRSQHVDGLINAVALPELDRYGVMVDYGAALREMISRPGGQSRFEVWLSPTAPSDIRTRLAKQGVMVIGVVHAGTFRTALDHTGPAFADELFLVAAITALLLAVGAALLAGVTTARRRAYEVAALEAAGVPGRALHRSLTVEQALLLGIGVIVGVGAGLAGCVLALPSTPFFVSDDIGPPIDHTLPWGLIGILIAALVAVFALTCLAVSWLVARQATAARFREAQQ